MLNNVMSVMRVFMVFVAHKQFDKSLTEHDIREAFGSSVKVRMK